MEVDAFDEVLKEAGEFGTYQRLLLAFVLLPGFVPCGFHAYNQLFLAATPDHWCRVPELEKDGLSLEAVKNMSIPFHYKDGRPIHSQCHMYNNINFDNVSLPWGFDETWVSTGTAASEVVPCKDGWNYDKSVYKSTVVTEWDLVCDYEFYPTLALVLLGFSGLVGYHVFGNIQDSLGRRPAFFIYLTIQCVFGIATCFAFDFWSWLITRIGVGFTVPAITGTPYVLASELVGPNQRTLCTILLNIAYSLCLMALPVVAYFFRDWRTLAFATVAPFLSFFAFWWVLPESPRWLFAHGKLQEAEKILRQIAHVNGKVLPRDYRKLLQEKYQEEKEEETQGMLAAGDTRKLEDYSTMDLFRSPVLRQNTIIITFIWFINLGVYVGLSYYAPILGGDEYLNFFLAGAAELPTYLFLYPCLNKWGRRWTLFTSMVIGGVSCISTILVNQAPWITLTLYCVGKFGISASFVAIQQMALEIYPTVVRGRGVSFSTVVGMIGPTFVPLVNYTGQEYLYLPLLTLGGLMVVGGLTGLVLPETLGRSLPQSLRDAEDLRPVACSKLSSCCRKRSKRNAV